MLLPKNVHNASYPVVGQSPGIMPVTRSVTICVNVRRFAQQRGCGAKVITRLSDSSGAEKGECHRSRYIAGPMPSTEPAPEAEIVDVAASVDVEDDDGDEVDEPDVVASVANEDVTGLAVLLSGRDSVVTGLPMLSVASGGSVVMSAAATVTFLIATPVLVYTQRHLGDSRGMKSPMRVVEAPML